MRRRSRPGADLTPREREVLDLVRMGLSNEQIARRLDVSVAGVKYHVSEILGKLGLENRHDAARWAALPAREREQRPWAGAVAPLGVLWRRLLAPSLDRAAGIVTISIAGIALAALATMVALLILVWDGEESSLDFRTHPDVLAALAVDQMESAESYRATYSFTPDAAGTDPESGPVSVDAWVLEWERPRTLRLYQGVFSADACRLAQLPEDCLPGLQEVIYQDAASGYSRRCFGVGEDCNPWLPRSPGSVAQRAKYPPGLALVALELGTGYTAQPTDEGWHLSGVVNYERVGDEAWRRFEGSDAKVEEYCPPDPEPQCVDVDSFAEYLFLKEAHGEYDRSYSFMDVWLSSEGLIQRFELRIERGLDRYEIWCIDFCWHSAHPGTVTVDYSRFNEIDIEPPREADLAY